MGLDIHMHIVQDQKYIKKDIIDWRNSEWFINMQGDGDDYCYQFLNIHDGLSPQSPVDIDVQKLSELSYFSFRYVNVEDFINWFQKYRPDIYAGWISTYEKWLMDNKGYIPEDPLQHLSADTPIEDFHFVEICNRYDCSRELYSYLLTNGIDNKADIIYWFDH